MSAMLRIFFSLAIFNTCYCIPSKSLTLPTVSLEHHKDSIKGTFNRAVGEIGAVAFTGVGMGHQYSQVVDDLGLKGLSCDKESFFVMPLEGGERRTIGQDTPGQNNFPPCISGSVAAITQAFDEVEMLAMDLLRDLVGEDMLRIKEENETVLKMEEMPMRTHFHLYSGGASYPLHTDMGLYLLVTPAPSQPLQIISRSGEIYSTAGLPSDSVIFLVGTGLTDWLLQGSAGALLHAAPHRVPVEAVLGAQDRAVVARMKLAPLLSTPLMSGPSFFSHFHSEPTSPLCPLPTWDSSNQAACEEGEALCWMNTCLPLPPGCTAADSICVSSDLLPCCTPEVTEDCQDMDGSCHWSATTEIFLLGATKS